MDSGDVGVAMTVDSSAIQSLGVNITVATTQSIFSQIGSALLNVSKKLSD